MTTLDDLRTQIGSDFGYSDWHSISQSQIDAFAQLTGDTQFIHVDPARAASTPFGGTIAHGFLTASMLSAMADQVIPDLAGVDMRLNYGFNRLRFVAPVPTDSRLRAAFTLTGIQDQPDRSENVIWAVRMDIEHADKPALIAEWVHRYYFTQSAR